MENKRLYFNNGGLLFSITVVVYVIVSFTVSLFLKMLFVADSFWYNAISPLCSVISIAGVLLFFKSKNKIKFSEHTSIKKFSPMFLIFAVLLSASMFFGLGFTNGVLIRGLKEIGLKVTEKTLFINGAGEYAVYLITLAVLPAFFEELFLRGGVFYGVRKNGLAAAFTSGLLFFLYHMSMAQSVYQFFYGVFLFILVRVSGSVIPASFSHFVNNFAVLTFSYLKIDLDLLNPYFIAGGILGLVLFCTLSAIKLKDKEKEDGIKLKIVYLYAVLGIIVCALVIISGLFVG